MAALFSKRLFVFRAVLCGEPVDGFRHRLAVPGSAAQALGE